MNFNIEIRHWLNCYNYQPYANSVAKYASLAFFYLSFSIIINHVRFIPHCIIVGV